MSDLHSRLARYAVCGVATTAVYLLVGHAVNQGIANPMASSSVAFLAAIAFNYVLQQAWVFARQTPARKSLPRYALMVTGGLVINAGTVGLLTGSVPLLWAQLAAAVLVVAANALLSFGWVFRLRRATR